MNENHGRGAAFLVELTAVILFFALSASVILMLFAAADRRSKESKRLSMAMLTLESAAEALRTADDPVKAFLDAYGAVAEGETYVAALEPKDSFGSAPKLVADIAFHEGLYEITLTAFDGDDAVYEIECANYVGEVGG